MNSDDTHQLSSIRSDGGRLAIHPLEVSGRFITARRLTFIVLVAIYVAAPLVQMGGHPSVHLDIEHRRFFLFGNTFNAQDVWMAVLCATAFLFSVLFITAWRGRIWCGFACPQTVFLEGIFRPIERFFDGPSSSRMRLRNAPWTASHVARASGKHLTYLLMAMALAHVASAVFVSPRHLTGMILEGPADHLEAFGWTSAFTLLLYFNFAWFREQFCVVLCPYGRLQSVLHDPQSITVAYDAQRGEPRGKLGSTSGDCIGCNKCVQACPTAIDIRNGLQMECLACAQCIDACDDVMTRIHKPKGLIRYASQSQLLKQKQKTLRPRLFVYLSLALISSSALGLSLFWRTPFEANVLRLRGVPFVVEGTLVRNQFEVHLINKHSTPATFHLVASGHPELRVELAQQDVTLASLEGTRIPLVLRLPSDTVHGKYELQLTVSDGELGNTRMAAIPFIAP